MIEINLKQYSKLDRVKEATKIFANLNIKPDIKNQGSHWIFRWKDEIIHYWPSTGRWYSISLGLRSTYETRFLAGLLTHMKIEYKETQ